MTTRKAPRPGTIAWTITTALWVGLATLGVTDVGAQTPWETPRMLSPDAPQGIGVYWVSFGALPQDGPGMLATWKAPGLPRGVSLRGGAARGAFGTTSGFAGLDLSTPLVSHTDSQPLDLVWTTGAGLGVGDHLMLTIPLGISAGRAVSVGAVWLAPYVSAGAAMDIRVGGEPPEKDFDVGPSVDVGLDLSLDPGRRLVFRVGTSLGDRNAIAVGAAFRSGR